MEISTNTPKDTNKNINVSKLVKIRNNPNVHQYVMVYSQNTVLSSDKNKYPTVTHSNMAHLTG